MNKAAVTQIINLLQDKVPQGYNQLIRETIASAKLDLTIAIVMIIVSIALLIVGCILIDGYEHEFMGIILCCIAGFLCMIGIIMAIYSVGVLTAPNVSLINNLITD
ncbi:hypothetical protein [Latilactobacillus curvatus]|uniref:hypothetical protein n=1 Tax=Latilactobacillus curvatus TaxID=28038 RepID=UPI00223AC8AF|nr:hypothetical protein [Latilactobacillus curvatus]MCS8616368.1 hypothetical protein [Latilactobacillus curvatus]